MVYTLVKLTGPNTGFITGQLMVGGTQATHRLTPTAHTNLQTQH